MGADVPHCKVGWQDLNISLSDFRCKKENQACAEGESVRARSGKTFPGIRSGESMPGRLLSEGVGMNNAEAFYSRKFGLPGTKSDNEERYG